MIWYCLFIILAICCYFYVQKRYKFWSNQGVDQGEPVFLFGHLWSNFIGLQSFSETIEMFYNVSKKSRYCGIYQIFKPTLILRDPELIKELTIKSFNHFQNHLAFLPEYHDELWRKSLFVLKNQQWRKMRTAVSPAFSQSKLKSMFSMVSQSAEDLVQHILDQQENLVTLEMKEVFRKHLTDVTLNVIFGIKCNSLKDPNNIFYQNCKKLDIFGYRSTLLKAFGYLLYPKIFKFIKVLIFPKEIHSFFRKLVDDAIKFRQENEFVKPYTIYVLLKSKQIGAMLQDSRSTNLDSVEDSSVSIEDREFGKDSLTTGDVTAQAVQLFAAGFETAATLLSFTLYELALNSEIQEKLANEVLSTQEICNGQIDYESLMQMKYIDMVILESLRKWPPNGATDRVCNESYIIQPTAPTESPLHISKGQNLLIPIYGLHRDPNYFPNPERFDPDRFSDENKTKIKPFTFLPFGAGPRMCVGARFAKFEAKLVLFHLILNFEIVPVEKTEIPLKIVKTGFFLLPKNGIWLGLKRREKLNHIN